MSESKERSQRFDERRQLRGTLVRRVRTSNVAALVVTQIGHALHLYLELSGRPNWIATLRGYEATELAEALELAATAVQREVRQAPRPEAHGQRGD